MKYSLAIIAFALLLPTVVYADSMNIKMGPNGMDVNVQTDDNNTAQTTTTTTTSSQSGDDYTLSYKNHKKGKTIIKVVKPDGANACIFEGSKKVYSETIPFSYKAEGDTFYKVTIKCGGTKWSKKIEAKDGMVATLAVTCGQKPANININVNVQEQPQQQQQAQPEPTNSAMGSADFAKLVAAIKAEDFSDGKLDILKDGAAHRYFTSEQVGKLMDLFDFEGDKIKAAVVCYPKVVDKENWFTVYKHLEFDSSKDELRKKIK